MRLHDHIKPTHEQFEQQLLADIESHRMLAMAGASQAVDTSVSMSDYLQHTGSQPFIIICALLALGWAAYNANLINKVPMTHENIKIQKRSEEEIEKMKSQGLRAPPATQEETLELMQKIAELIKNGAITFLYKEYVYLGGFVIFFAIILSTSVEPVHANFPYTTCAFVIGALTSVAAGYIGMRIAVHANIRTTLACCESIDKGFNVAFSGGQVLGFSLVGLALLVLELIILIFSHAYLPERESSEEEAIQRLKELFEMIAGFGLGASTVALFSRVGGGIYTKAADVGADLAGKVCAGLPEDSPDNPGTIADNVGDNVGDIAGMGADLFGSLAEATCAALVVSASSINIMKTDDAIYFPLIITAVGIISSIVTTFLMRSSPITKHNIESKLKQQLLFSTIIMTFMMEPATAVLPEKAEIHFAGEIFGCSRYNAYWCVVTGLWSGLFIGYVTEYFTSSQYEPVQELAESCRMGAAPNVILGLALGYTSTVVPILCLAFTICVTFSFGGMYGVALAALGMLGCLPIALTIDGFGPIADNAGGIAEMAYLDKSVRNNTDKLDAAGNTTAAIGKGFAIGSACLVALALFGAYIVRAGDFDSDPTTAYTVNILNPITFAGLLVGAMMPYAFSAMTMTAVGNAANEMIKEIKRQFPGIKEGKEPDYQKCIEISTNASLSKMVAPGALVIFTPLLGGVFFGHKAVSGLIAGQIVSGIQLAFSFSNTGGAWDNAKKYIEEGIHTSKEMENQDDSDDEVEKKGELDAETNVSKQQEDPEQDAEKDTEKDNQKDPERKVFIFRKKDDDGKPTEEHIAAVICDTIGDPLKDTSGPSLNILIKLSAITSLVFGTMIAKRGGVLLGYNTDATLTA